ncbi:hypothetical protein ElyMa_001938800 [Elysia marginata]|uniref:Uncharacterized protein n=1 Tax=Elysia marginata TaxID=1093978 RepID=A0AAV4EWD1_9GAST|nr:hypothetical protein ElyMa_001938800 [Elysia marginata]
MMTAGRTGCRHDVRPVRQVDGRLNTTTTTTSGWTEESVVKMPSHGNYIKTPVLLGLNPKPPDHESDVQTSGPGFSIVKRSCN